MNHDVPMPGQRHPDLPDIDPASATHGYLFWDEPEPEVATYDGGFRLRAGPFDLIRFKRRLLERKRCAGPAPYVGRPFRYEWWALVDERTGRAIGGEAYIAYSPITDDSRTWPTAQGWRADGSVGP